MHAGQHRLQLGERDHPSPPILAQLCKVGRGIDLLLKIAVKIKMIARPPNQIGPDIQIELAPVSGKDFLPGEQFRTFAIDDNAIEIENECFDHD